MMDQFALILTNENRFMLIATEPPSDEIPFTADNEVVTIDDTDLVTVDYD